MIIPFTFKDYTVEFTIDFLVIFNRWYEATPRSVYTHSTPISAHVGILSNTYSTCLRITLNHFYVINVEITWQMWWIIIIIGHCYSAITPHHDGACKIVINILLPICSIQDSVSTLSEVLQPSCYFRRIRFDNLRHCLRHYQPGTLIISICLYAKPLYARRHCTTTEPRRH